MHKEPNEVSSGVCVFLSKSISYFSSFRNSEMPDQRRLRACHFQLVKFVEDSSERTRRRRIQLANDTKPLIEEEAENSIVVQLFQILE